MPCKCSNNKRAKKHLAATPWRALLLLEKCIRAVPPIFNTTYSIPQSSNVAHALDKLQLTAIKRRLFCHRPLICEVEVGAPAPAPSPTPTSTPSLSTTPTPAAAFQLFGSGLISTWLGPGLFLFSLLRLRIAKTTGVVKSLCGVAISQSPRVGCS